MNWPDDIPMQEAVREYMEQRLPAKDGEVTLCWQDKADAAIAALEKELTYYREHYELVFRQRNQAEAEVAGRPRGIGDGDIHALFDRAEKAEYAARENRQAMDNAVKAWREAEAEARQWADSFKLAEQSIVDLQAEVARLRAVSEELQTELLQAALDHDFTIPTLAARLARWEAEHK